MPELPEVETIRLGLQKYLVGHRILDVEIREKKIFQGDKKDIVGAKVKNIDRVGKGLLIELDNNYVMAIHLKLTGQIIYRKVSKAIKVSKVSKGEKETGIGRLSEKAGGELLNKFTHVIFKLDKGAFLYYNDMRKFGWIKIIESSKLKAQSFFKDIGPEPPVIDVSKEEKVSKVSKGVLTLEKFREIVWRGNLPIKVLLLDQKKISGIGNIYANEALFKASIDPRRKANSLKEAEVKKLYDSIIDVLKKGIKYGGASDVNFVNVLGEDGKYQEHFLIYGRKGEKCKGCEGVVQKIQLGGRGTYFCHKCQK